MEDMDLKKKTLQEIIDLMDQKDGDRLKVLKKPELMAATIEVGKDPKAMMEDSPEEEASETPMMEKSEDMKDGDEISPEMIQKLLEMMNGK